MTNSCFMSDIKVVEGMKLKTSLHDFHNGAQIRTVCLRRPPLPPVQQLNIQNVKTNNFGFSIRGGKEHNIAFFITNVVKNSVAEQNGLQIGDQILEMNGFNIDNSLHKEIVQLISSHDRIIMKVRNTGVLPIQNLEQNFITFCNIAEATATTKSPTTNYTQNSVICAQNVNGRNSSTIQIKNVVEATKTLGQNRTVIKLMASPVNCPMIPMHEQSTLPRTYAQVTQSSVNHNQTSTTTKAATTLSDAISQELKKREQKQNRSMPRPNGAQVLQEVPKSVSHSHKKVDNAHNALLDEFKRVHQRLISSESKKD